MDESDGPDGLPAPRPALALLTGASSGIGAAMARELARRGHALLLVARDEASLRAVSAEVPTSAEVVVADLADPQDLGRVERLVGDRRPGLVVNAAATGRHGPLDAQAPEDLDATVAVDVLAPLRLTAAALRVGAGVVNVSSTASDAEVPELAPYAASKAFLESFSMSVSAPADGRGRPVTVVRPGYTRTAFHRRLGEDVSDVPAHLWCTPDDIARRALDAFEAGHRRVTLVAPTTRTARARRLVRRVLRLATGGERTALSP